MKALVGEADDRILGFTMIGAEAGEVMAVVETAMMADLPYTRLQNAVLAHPTMAEGLGFLFSERPGPAGVARALSAGPAGKRAEGRNAGRRVATPSRPASPRGSGAPRAGCRGRREPGSSAA